MAVPLPAAAEVVADGETMEVDITPETEAVAGACNNQPKSGSGRGTNGSRDSGDGGSHDRGEASGRGGAGKVAPTALAMTAAGSGGGG